MVDRIEVALKHEFDDPEGNGVKSMAKEYFGLDIGDVRVIDVKSIDSKLGRDNLERSRKEIFGLQKVSHISTLNVPLANEFDWDYALWIGYKPGVMDPPGHTAVEAMKDMLKVSFSEEEDVYTSKIYLLKGGVTEEDVETIARERLANDLIQRFEVISRDEWDEKTGFQIPSSKVILTHEPTVMTFPMTSKEELMKLSKERNLALNSNDIPTIMSLFSNPDVLEERAKSGLSDSTDVELEYIAQRRSDHCSHNTFNGRFHYVDLSTNEKNLVENLFDECIKTPTLKLAEKKDWVKSILWDNAGIAEFCTVDGKTYNYAIKGETHNSPSNMEAYGGAITGNVGVFRDDYGAGKGAKVFLGLYGFGVAPRDYDGDLKPKLLPKRLLDGIIEGVKDGANKSGIPTPFGNLLFHDGYIGKSLVFVGAAGIMPAEINGEPTHEKHIDDGDLCVMIGGRVGKDGIHGVTASSEEYSENTPAGHVQIGFPYSQKKTEGLILEARDRGLIKFITDIGGGGLSSAGGESCEHCGEHGGLEFYLDRVPLKYPGMHPWEIWVSESQERMLLAVSPENIEEFMELKKKHAVESTVVGTYKDSGRVHILYNDETVMDMPLEFMKSDFPQWEFEAEWIPPEMRGLTEPVLSEPIDYASSLKEMLGRPNICSKEWIVRQYDHEVQGGSVIKPLVGVERDVHSGAVVTRPVLDSNRGFGVTQVINPWFSEIDTYWMTAYIIDEAVRKLIAVGGNLDHIGGVDNFCWPNIQYDPETNPDGKYKAAQLVRSNWALRDYVEKYKTVLLSGKDSMYIDGTHPGKHGVTQKISGPPTLQFTANTVIDDCHKCVSMDAKIEGDLVYVLGETKDELGGSEYYDMFGHTGLNVPKVDAEKLLPMYRALQTAIEDEIVASAHAVSRGGLGVHLAEVAFAGNLGMDIYLDKVPRSVDRDDKILYSESAGRLIVTIDPEKREEFEELFEGYLCSQIGYVNDTGILNVSGVGGENIIGELIGNLKSAYKQTFGDLI